MASEFEEQYRKKLTTASEAVKVIKSGDWVDYGWSIGMPDELDKALAARYEELEDVNVRGGNALKVPAIFQVPDNPKHFTWNSWHFSSIERKYQDQGFVFYTPIRYSELPVYYRQCIRPNDVIMFQVAPMDDHGYFNFGPNASHMVAACEKSKITIVEVNENMPRCLGGMEESIHISKIDMIVEGKNPPIGTIQTGAPTERDKKMAEYVVEEIEDGDCLQLGIGNTPNAIGSLIAKSDLKDLGVHTEMYVDAFGEMAEAHKVNCSRKTIDRFRQVYAFAVGSKRLYEYLDDNPALMSVSVSYTNDITRISSIDHFMSINSAINVDLYGQVNAETAGFRHISGAGGQLDFVIGAFLSDGGKSFICCPSTFTDKEGKVHSSILSTMPQGTVMTDTRANIHYLVTEYGKVNLKGLSSWQRAEAIISVAHPDFRDELICEAEKMHIWRRSNKRS
jgi:butyryl-CoA:acetate CoA-transferase